VAIDRQQFDTIIAECAAPDNGPAFCASRALPAYRPHAHSFLTVADTVDKRPKPA